MNARGRWTVCALAISLMHPFPVTAAEDAAVISCNGTAKLVKQPDVLRLRIQLVARADTMAETVQRFADLKTAARAQLGALGAEPDSIEFTLPALTDAKTDQQRQMEMMVAQRMRGSRRKPDAEAKPKVAMSTALTAEWTLKANSPEDRLVEIHELQERITDADLGGVKDREMSPEEEEMMDEMGSMGYMSMDERGMTEPCKPSFVVVSRITDQEHMNLLTESMARARESAARLAKAVGASLGPLKSVSAVSAGMDPSDPSGYGRYYMYQMMAGNAPDPTDTTNEAVNSNPGAVTFHVAVTATFGLDGGE